MLVRSFQLSDYVAVTGVLQSVLSEECYRETIRAIARQLSWDSELVLVAEDEGEIAGVIIGTIDNNTGYYYRIAVHTDHQRKGIGKAMIQALKQRFGQRKVKRIYITIDEHNEPILPVYESVGYVQADFNKPQKQLSIVNG